MNQEKITKFITELRKEKKLTQQEFADILGVTNSAVSKWESGKCLPDPTLYETIADYFNISISELLAGKRENKKRKPQFLLWVAIILILLNIITFVKYYQLLHSTTIINKIKVSNDNLLLNGILITNKKESYILISNLSIPTIEEGIMHKPVNNLVVYLKSKNHVLTKIEKDVKEQNDSLSFNNNFVKAKEIDPDDLIIEYSYFDGLKEVHHKEKINIISIDNNSL